MTIATQTGFTRAIKYFKCRFADADFKILDLSEDELDWSISDRVVKMYFVNEDGAVGMIDVVTFASALSNLFLRFKLELAWRCLDVWKHKHPPQ